MAAERMSISAAARPSTLRSMRLDTDNSRRRGTGPSASIALWLFLAGAVLSGCASPGAPGVSTVFTPANAFQAPRPPGAAIVSPAQFEHGIESGGLQLFNPRSVAAAKAAARKAALIQLAQDRATLEAAGADRQSPEIKRLLAAVAGAQDPLAEPTVAVRQRSGRTEPIVLLSPAMMLRAAAASYLRGSSPKNALDAYRMAYAAGPARAVRGLPSPDTLKGQPRETIQSARARLNEALSGVPNLDGTRREVPARLTAASSGVGAPAPGGPGLGSDGPSPDCVHDPKSVYMNIYWPLKRFISPTKDQGHRGLCWDFAAIGALESMQQVATGVASLDLSEQAFAYGTKFRPGTSTPIDIAFYDDGYFAELALTFGDWVVPNEGFWSYNPSSARQPTDDPIYQNACVGYGGVCSASPHQAPVVCADKTDPYFGTQTYCGYQPVAFPPGNEVFPGVNAQTVPTTDVWHTGDPLPVDTLRSFLANGQTILASLDLYQGFFSTKPGYIGATGDPTGFVTKYDTDQGSAGGHQVLIVGYIDNQALAYVNAPPSASGGYFIIKNSWGCVADGGFYYVPADYIADYFINLAVLSMPEARSARWMDSQNAPPPPTVDIVLPSPVKSGVIQANTVYVDFSKPITFFAVATNAAAGVCCANTMIWDNTKRGVFGTGMVVAADLSGDLTYNTTEDNVSVSVSDSDGNIATNMIRLADAYPQVFIDMPIAGAVVALDAPTVFSARETAFGSGQKLDCSHLMWLSSTAGDGSGLGCTTTFTFHTAGTRTVTAEDDTPKRGAKASIVIDVQPPVPNGPPQVGLQIVQHDDSSANANANVQFSITDPSGPGGQDLSQYTLKWEAQIGGVRRVIPTVAWPFSSDMVIALPSTAFTIPSCVQGEPPVKQVIVYLTVTGRNGQSGGASTSYDFTLPVCLQ